MKTYYMLFAIVVTALSSYASPWTTYSLPDTTAPYNVWALGHADGRYIYAENGTIFRQNSFGNSAYTQFGNSPGVYNADPSFIATGSDTSGVIGSGGWGASTLKTFDPSNTSSSFTDSSFTMSNYSAEMRDASSLYIAGANGTSGSNNITYVTTDGSKTQTLIADVSLYSAAITLDAAGNLYVGDNDDGKIYKFSESQLTSAINANTALQIDDGAFICDFGTGGNIGSLAVDANDVLWGAGWAANGIQSYDPDSDLFYTWTPGFDSSNYLVDTFSENGTDYVAFANASGSATGSEVIYGIADAEAVPEPASVMLILLGTLGIAGYRRYKMYLRL